MWCMLLVLGGMDCVKRFGFFSVGGESATPSAGRREEKHSHIKGTGAAQRKHHCKAHSRKKVSSVYGRF